MTIRTEELEEDLVYPTVVRDVGGGERTYLGMYGIPPRGGRWWVADCGCSGYCEDEKEARREIASRRGHRIHRRKRS